MSFTRTAVHELRNRALAALVKGDNTARGVENSYHELARLEDRELAPRRWAASTRTETRIEEAVRALQRTSQKENELKVYLQRFSHLLRR